MFITCNSSWQEFECIRIRSSQHWTKHPIWNFIKGKRRLLMIFEALLFSLTDTELFPICNTCWFMIGNKMINICILPFFPFMDLHSDQTFSCNWTGYRDLITDQRSHTCRSCKGVPTKSVPFYSGCKFTCFLSKSFEICSIRSPWYLIYQNISW